MKVFSTPAELAAAVGTEIGTGDWLAVEQSRIADATEVPGAYQIVSRVTIEVEGQEKPACVAETVVRLYT